MLNKNYERIINVLNESNKPLTKIEIRNLGGRATRSKLSSLIDQRVVKRNKIVVPVIKEDIEMAISESGVNLIKNKSKRLMKISKLKEMMSKEKFYYTYDLI